MAASSTTWNRKCKPTDKKLSSWRSSIFWLLRNQWLNSLKILWWILGIKTIEELFQAWYSSIIISRKQKWIRRHRLKSSLKTSWLCSCINPAKRILNGRETPLSSARWMTSAPIFLTRESILKSPFLRIFMLKDPCFWELVKKMNSSSGITSWCSTMRLFTLAFLNSKTTKILVGFSEGPPLGSIGPLEWVVLHMNPWS